MAKDGNVNPLILAPVALVTGLFLGVAIGAVTALAKWDLSPWVIGLVGFAIVSALTWLILLGWWRRLTEGVLGVKTIPSPSGQIVPLETVHVEFRDTTGGDDYPSVWWHDLPGGLVKLQAVALAIEGGAKFSHGLSGPGKALTRGQYEGLRDCLLEHRYLRWKDQGSRKEGVRLTARGAALMRTLAGTPAGDLPQSSRRRELLPIAREDTQYTQSLQRLKGR